MPRRRKRVPVNLEKGVPVSSDVLKEWFAILQGEQMHLARIHHQKTKKVGYELERTAWFDETTGVLTIEVGLKGKDFPRASIQFKRDEHNFRPEPPA